MPGDGDEFLTVAELAALLKIGRKKAYEMAREIGITRVGRAIRIHRADLDSWRKAQRPPHARRRLVSRTGGETSSTYEPQIQPVQPRTKPRKNR